MKSWEKKLNPLTVKRLRRFKRLRRSYLSFWAIIVLYSIGLFAEFLCNDRPIYVQFGGESYFPIFRYYPDDDFTGSGKKTRPNYKEIASSEAFTTDPSNFMLFPPVRYGPREIIDPNSIKSNNDITLHFRPVPRVGTLNIRKDFSISRSSSCEYFFQHKDRDLKNKNLVDFWNLTDELKNSIEDRFNNLSAVDISVNAESVMNPGLSAEISLTTYESRERPPKTIRLTFRESRISNGIEKKIVFSPSLQIVSDNSNLWQDLTDEDQDRYLRKISTRYEQLVPDELVKLEDVEYEVSFIKEEVTWPYPPIAGHWLGIDNAGRDVLARIVYGLRISMTFGVILVILSMALGIFFGAIQGYYGGHIDIVTQRLIEIWSALPFLYIMILMGSVYGRSFGLLLILYGIFNWIGISYYLRAEFLKLRKQPFVEAARCMGIPDYVIIFKHILPNALVPVITFFPFSLVGAIGSLAALDYLGFGLPPPTPSWGELLAQAQQYRWAWWLILYPSIALFIVMLLGVFIGEGIRNAFDPRQYSKLR